MCLIGVLTDGKHQNNIGCWLLFQHKAAMSKIGDVTTIVYVRMKILQDVCIRSKQCNSITGKARAGKTLLVEHMLSATAILQISTWPKRLQAPVPQSWQTNVRLARLLITYRSKPTANISADTKRLTTCVWQIGIPMGGG